jgi:prepilin peptidase CpaA
MSLAVSPSTLGMTACLLLCGTAAITDLRWGVIPNRLTYGAIALGLPLQILARTTATGAAGELFRPCSLALATGYAGASLVVCGLVPYAMFLLRAAGGGDVKLLAAVGAFLGPLLGLEVTLGALLMAALVVPARLAYQGRLMRSFASSLHFMGAHLLRTRVPHPSADLVHFKLGPAVFVALALEAALYWRAA